MDTPKPTAGTKTEAGLPAPTGSDSRRPPAHRALRKFIPIVLACAAATASPAWLALPFLALCYGRLVLNEYDE